MPGEIEVQNGASSHEPIRRQKPVWLAVGGGVCLHKPHKSPLPPWVLIGPNESPQTSLFSFGSRINTVAFISQNNNQSSSVSAAVGGAGLLVYHVALPSRQQAW